jgi:6-phosphogluconolactonase (cycloisomerase 2 family)
MNRIHRRAVGALAAALLAGAPLTVATAAAATTDQGYVPSVFVQTNSARGNAVRAFSRADDGSLTPAGSFATGGLGSATTSNPTDPLASQGSLVADRSRNDLYAVNAGSNTLTRFSVHGVTLRREQVIDTDGTFPVSVAVAGEHVYVLNAGGDGSVIGYRRAADGLHKIAGSVRSLGLGGTNPPLFIASPAQIGVSADGDHLLVTTKNAGTVAVFGLRADGRPSETPTTTATGPVPFPFLFDAAGRLVLGDASGVLSTWSLGVDGALHRISAAPNNGQAALCWVADVGGHLYTTNTGSNTVTGYTESPDGALQLLDADGVTAVTDSGPIDLAGTADGRFLYVLNGTAGTAAVYAVAADGSLDRVGTQTGLPVNSSGSPGMQGVVVT